MPDGMIKQLVNKREIYSFKPKQDQGWGWGESHTRNITTWGWPALRGDPRNMIHGWVIAHLKISPGQGDLMA